MDMKKKFSGQRKNVPRPWDHSVLGMLQTQKGGQQVRAEGWGKEGMRRSWLEMCRRVLCIGEATQPSHPLTPSSPSALNLFQHQGLFQWIGCSNQVTKILELQLQHHSFHEYSGLISLKIDWFDLLAVQGTLRSLFQHQSLKASILWHSAFSLKSSSHNHTWQLGRL